MVDLYPVVLSCFEDHGTVSWWVVVVLLLDDRVLVLA